MDRGEGWDRHHETLNSCAAPGNEPVNLHSAVKSTDPEDKATSRSAETP
jgi:hypothetical protein